MSPPRRLVGISTKMYLSLSQTRTYIASILDRLPPSPDVDIFILVDHVALIPSAAQVSAHTPPKLLIGAQDAAANDRGAFTGQVSPVVLAEAGCRIVMVGHAERRRMFGETDAAVRRKTLAVARNNMMPLICFGELEEGPVEDAVSFCRAQVDAILKETPVREVILAYEPIWAIGKEHPASAKHILRVLEGVRELDCVKTRGELLKIVYGGSAGPGTFAEMAGLVDGLFMARFGLDIEKLVGVVREVSEAPDTLDFVSAYATDHMCQASSALS